MFPMVAEAIWGERLVGRVLGHLESNIAIVFFIVSPAIHTMTMMMMMIIKKNNTTMMMMMVMMVNMIVMMANMMICVDVQKT